MSGYFIHAVRGWRSAKAPALLAILALAAGIGSTTAIFTVINGVLLQPVPYTGGERWVSLFGGDLHDPRSRSSLTVPTIIEFQKRTQSFEVFGWLAFNTVTLTAPGTAQHLESVEVTSEVVNALGVNPVMGSWFRTPTAEPVVVISDRLWKRLGGDRAFLGKPITLGARTYTVVGIMAPGFRFPLASPGGDLHTDVWLPLDAQGRGVNNLIAFFGIARRKVGISQAAAEGEVSRVAAEVVRESPRAQKDWTAHADGMVDIAVKELRPTLLLLFAAAGVLLLITCANVAGLLVARSVDRARETALRVALGATSLQLGSQYFFEGAVLAVIGSALGLAVTPAVVKLAVAESGHNVPGAGFIGLDWRVLGFTVAIACATSILASLAPLFQALRTPPNEVLSEGVRASTGARSRKLTHALVIGEIALAFLLLACGAVLANRLRAVQRTNAGFQVSQLLTFQLTVGGEQRHGPQRATLVRNLLTAVGAIPGVSSAAVVNQVPLAGCCYTTAVYPAGSGAEFRVPKTSFVLINPGYFATMGIPLRRGRLLTDGDIGGKVLPVIINEQAARMYWPGKEALGATAHAGAPDGSPLQVVGVVGDVRNEGLSAEGVPEFYFHHSVSPMNPIHVMVRTGRSVSSIAKELAAAVQTVDKDVPVHDLRSMEEIREESMVLERSSSWVTVFFAGAAVWMAALGVYGVVSYSARQRTVEIGTRMAFGAVPGNVIAMVVQSGWLMAVGGVILGAVAYAACIPLLSTTLGIRETGPWPAVFAALVVTVVGLGSGFFPAWRASLLSPMVAIRNEPGSMWETVKRNRTVREEEEDAPRAEVLRADFIQASREAGSFRDALASMLAILCTRTGARSALLLERSASGEFVCTATTGAAIAPLASDGFLLGRLRFHSGALPLPGADYEPLRRWAEAHQPGYRKELDALDRGEARLAIALQASREMLGVLLFGPPKEGDGYSVGLRAALDASAPQFALMLENARLADRVVEQEKVGRELALAAEVQQRLLPQRVPESAAASFAAVSLPARSVGGDYYDFLQPRAGTIGIAIADVAGKGVGAALLTSMVQASLRLTAEGNGDLPAVVGRMNRFLKQTMGGNRGSFATFFYGVFDEQSRQLRYVNAGHNPPMLVRADRVELLGRTGLVIGMFEKAEYAEAEVTLQSGDVLFVFTDGVSEARNAQGEEFGEQRIEALLRQSAVSMAGEISEQVRSALEAFGGNTPAHDDITFVVMKVH